MTLHAEIEESSPKHPRRRFHPGHPACHKNKSSRFQILSDFRVPNLITPGLWVTASWPNKHGSGKLWSRLRWRERSIGNTLPLTSFHLILSPFLPCLYHQVMGPHLQFLDCIIQLKNYQAVHQIFSRSSKFPSCTPSWSQWGSVAPLSLPKRFCIRLWPELNSSAHLQHELCLRVPCTPVTRGGDRFWGYAYQEVEGSTVGLMDESRESSHNMKLERRELAEMLPKYFSL